MTRFEPQTSGVGSNCFTNWATTTAQFYSNLSDGFSREWVNGESHSCQDRQLQPNQPLPAHQRRSEVEQYDHQAEEQEADSDDRGIKLGLGDFIFYSILVIQISLVISLT